jgi:hypothetical protein
MARETGQEITVRDAEGIKLCIAPIKLSRASQLAASFISSDMIAMDVTAAPDRGCLTARRADSASWCSAFAMVPVAVFSHLVFKGGVIPGFAPAVEVGLGQRRQ